LIECYIIVGGETMNKQLIKNNIKELRNMRGITQQELADEIFSTKQNVSKYERGEVIPPIDVLIDIAMYFDVSIDYLLNDYLTTGKLELILNKDSFDKYFNLNLKTENLSNLQLKNDIYISNIKKELAVIDHFDENPQIEYIESNSRFDSYEFTDVVLGRYKKNLKNSTIHHSDSILTVPELLKIINSLGSNYDYLEKPGSIRMTIENEFIAMVKMTTMQESVDGRYILKLNYSELLLSQFYEYQDITFTEQGYQKNRDRVSEIINEKYRQVFKADRIDAPMDEAHFLQYIIENIDQLPKNLEDLHKEFNSKSQNIYSQIGKSMVKIFIESALKKVLPDVFDIQIIYDFGKPGLSINGIISSFEKSSEACDVTSLVNYLITEKYEGIQITNLWKDSFYEYANKLGLDYNENDISINFRDKYVWRESIDSYMNKYNDFIKTKWVHNNMNLLNLKILKIIKSIIFKLISG